MGMSLKLDVFVDGLAELDRYLDDLYNTRLAVYVKQFEGTNLHPNVSSFDQQYRKTLDGFRSRLRTGVSHYASGIKSSDAGMINAGFNEMAESSGALYQLLDPDADVFRAKQRDGPGIINGMYSNQDLAGSVNGSAVDRGVFENGSRIIEAYYIKPLQEMMEESQKARNGQTARQRGTAPQGAAG